MQIEHYIVMYDFTSFRIAILKSISNDFLQLVNVIWAANFLILILLNEDNKLPQ